MTLIRNTKLSVLFACLSLSILWGDQIVLKDGDRITGSIVKKDGQTITMLSKNFGLVTLKWDDIATVRTDQPLNIVLAGDQTVKATIKTQDGRIEVAAAGAPRTVNAWIAAATASLSAQLTYSTTNGSLRWSSSSRASPVQRIGRMRS